MVAEWPERTGSRRMHTILITMHGKNICHPLLNMILAALRNAVANEQIVDPGTRALVLWLAEHKQLPAVPKKKKEGYWAIDHIYYGYLHPSLFTYSAVPEAKGFSGSAEKHRFVSTCMDPQTAREIGLLGASTAACGCAECAQFNFSSCLMKGLGGMATQLGQFKTPRVRGGGGPSQTQSLDDFAVTLGKDQVRGVCVDNRDRGIEGIFWLCLVLGKATIATERQARATELFEKGWWIVDIMWYKYDHERGVYVLLPATPSGSLPCRRWCACAWSLRAEGGACAVACMGSASRCGTGLRRVSV